MTFNGIVMPMNQCINDCPKMGKEFHSQSHQLLLLCPWLSDNVAKNGKWSVVNGQYANGGAA